MDAFFGVADAAAIVVLIIGVAAALVGGIVWISTWLKAHPLIAGNLSFAFGMCIIVPAALLIGVGLGRLVYVALVETYSWLMM